MKRRDALMGVAAVAVAAPVMANDKTGCIPAGPQTTNAAGTLLLLATAEHGADGLRMAFEALANQARPC